MTVNFLFAVDNTLLDNDRVSAELKKHLQKEVGQDRQQHYWNIYEQLRVELGYADYLGALQRYRMEYPRDPHILTVSNFLINYPFANRLYPNSLDAVECVKKWGKAIILSDGDAVFQPRKVSRSGLFDVMDGVLIYVHKEHELDDVEDRYPAEHYVVLDDKLRILAAMKNVWEGKLTTVFVQQGHYAKDEKAIEQYPAADIAIERIGDFQE